MTQIEVLRALKKYSVAGKRWILKNGNRLATSEPLLYKRIVPRHEIPMEQRLEMYQKDLAPGAIFIETDKSPTGYEIEHKDKAVGFWIEPDKIAEIRAGHLDDGRQFIEFVKFNFAPVRLVQAEPPQMRLF